MRLGGHQLSNWIFLEFLDMTSLAINYYLVKKQSIYFTLSNWAFSYILIERYPFKRSIQSYYGHDHRPSQEVL